MKKVVTIVGVGSLGSHLVQFIRNLDITLRVVDFDRVEQKNTRSQFHAKPHVGKIKTLSLQQTMMFLFGYKIDVLPHKMTQDNVQAMLGNSDLLIDCLDNGEARALMQEFSRKTKTPCLHGALAANGGFGRVVWDENFVIDYGKAGAPTCEDGDFLPFIAVVSAYLAKAAQEFLANGKKVGFEINPTGCLRV